MHECSHCGRSNSSNSVKGLHIREKHTFTNCIDTICVFCDKEFKSPIYNKRTGAYNKKCEECRDIQVFLETNHLVSDTYVYKGKERYYVNKGTIRKVCPVYDCFIKGCSHNPNIIVQCIGSKCSKCYEPTGFNQCTICRGRGDNSKNKLRQAMCDLKQELGGRCIACGETDGFKLEFDHIDPSKKQYQISRSRPNNWIGEKDNLQLLCGNCHRIKTHRERESINPIKKQHIIVEIKKSVGGCQSCGWSNLDPYAMSAGLDFDHIQDKIKQISKCSKTEMLYEMTKTRLLCRNCHEMVTCIQRGGRMLDIYYTQEQIQEFKYRLMCKDVMHEQNRRVIKVVVDWVINGY